jgi:hypothetical protein
MKPTFYIVFALPLLVASGCAKEPPKVSKEPTVSLDQLFAFRGKPKPYKLPKDGLVERWVEKLSSGSRRGLRFAKERLRENPAEAYPLLVRGLEEHMAESSRVGLLVNLCGALGNTKNPDAAELLLKVITQSTLPVVRSTAVEALARVGSPALVHTLLEQAKGELEPGVLKSLLVIIAQFGEKDGVDFLASRVRAWSTPGPGGEMGVQAWSALLAATHPSARVALASLTPTMAPPLQVEGLLKLVEWGETDGQEELRLFLDADRYPSARVRRSAVIGLALLSDWQGVLMATTDEDPLVRTAVIDAFQLPAAQAEGIGESHLVEWSGNPNPNMAYPALHALLKRGQHFRIDPWLNLASGYPSAPGSLGALRLFLQDGIQDSRIVQPLLDRWSSFDRSQRIDVLRVFSKMASEVSLRHLVFTASNPQEIAAVREQAISSYAFSDKADLLTLLGLWNSTLPYEEAERLFSGAANHADDPRFEAFAVELLQRDDLPPTHLRIVLELLPLTLHAKGLALLLEARSARLPSQAIRYIDFLLNDFY